MGVEINKHSDIIGVVTKQSIPEGRMVILTTPGDTYGFGSRGDLPGIRLPATSAEAAKAKYVAIFAQDNRSLPIYQPMPTYDYNLRDGWGVDSDNVPIAGATIYLTHPGNMIGQTIPSGELAVAHGGGVYTVPSGYYNYSADLETPGEYLEALNIADDTLAEAGKLSYIATLAGSVAIVERYNSTTGALQFRTLVP